MLPGAALGSLAARFCWQGQHFRALDGTRARFGAPPPLMLPGAALGSLAARFCWQGQHFKALDPTRARFGAPLLRASSRFCWQGQHFRLWTVPERS